VLFAIVASVLFAQSAAPPSREVVTIDKITVEGTRFTLNSIQVLTGLHPGVQIDELAVRQAIARMLESGLIRSVDYNYESLADPHRVVLQLTVVDETPLLPASIEIPGVDPEPVWQYLQSVDPLFTRELPRTQKALRFYIRAITDYLRTNKRQESLVPIVTGDDSGHPSGIVFAPAPSRPLPSPGTRKN
jgi:hypothetical protein